VANSSANCTVEIPLAFAVSNLQNGASLSYQIDAYTGSGPVFARTQEGIAVGYPQLAGGTELSVDVAF
jgi:hypothetical protein